MKLSIGGSPNAPLTDKWYLQKLRECGIKPVRVRVFDAPPCTCGGCVACEFAATRRRLRK